VPADQNGDGISRSQPQGFRGQTLTVPPRTKRRTDSPAAREAGHAQRRGRGDGLSRGVCSTASTMASGCRAKGGAVRSSSTWSLASPRGRQGRAFAVSRTSRVIPSAYDADICATHESAGGGRAGNSLRT
jgi:hypothetical protein